MSQPIQSDTYIDRDHLDWLTSQGIKIPAKAPDDVLALVRQCIWQPALNSSDVELEIDRSIIAPAQGVDAVFFAGGVVDHDTVLINGISTQDFISDHIDVGPGSYFIVPANVGGRGCLELNNFSYEVFLHISIGNLTTPMAICSPVQGWCLAWDADLEYSFVARFKGSTAMSSIFAQNEPLMKVFIKEYIDLIPDGQRHIYLLNRYVLPHGIAISR